MNRTEFLAAISLRLQDLPVEERDEAVKYYSEYLDEVGSEREDAVIGELGGAEKVSNIIRANCGYGPVPQQPKAAPKPELTLEGPGYSHAQAFPRAHAPIASDANEDEAAQAAALGQHAEGAGQEAQAGAPYGASGRVGKAFANTSSNRILWILVLVLSFPIWMGLVAGLLGGVFGIFGGIIGITVGGVSAILGGVVNFVAGIMLLGTSVASGLATMGVSLLALALGVLLFAGGALLLKKGIPLVVRWIGNLLRWIGGKVGR